MANISHLPIPSPFVDQYDVSDREFIPWWPESMSVGSAQQASRIPRRELQSSSVAKNAGKQMLDESAAINRFERRCGVSLTVIDEELGTFGKGLLFELGIPAGFDVLCELKSSDVAVLPGAMSGTWIYAVRVPGTSLLAGGLVIQDEEATSKLRERFYQVQPVPESQFQNWVLQHRCRHPDLLSRLLQTVHDIFREDLRRSRQQVTQESSSLQIGMMYEVLVALRDMTRDFAFDQSPQEFADEVAQRLQLICRTELAAIVHSEGGKVYGELPLDPQELYQGVERLAAGSPSRILVKNHLHRHDSGRLTPHLRSLVAVHIESFEGLPAWLILANPWGKDELGSEEANLVRYFSSLVAAKSRHAQLWNARSQMVLGFVRSLVSTIDAKDPCTRGHSERVALLGRTIAAAMSCSFEEQENIHAAGILHDIGKIGVDDSILTKPGKLSESEFQHMARHPEIGYRILCELKSLEYVLPGVLSHHERFDGKGYPQRIAGTRIPLMARILAVADSFDAMCSDRPYRQGMNRGEVEKILQGGAGTQWDPAIVEVFLKNKIEIYRAWDELVEHQQRAMADLSTAISAVSTSSVTRIGATDGSL